MTTDLRKSMLTEPRDKPVRWFWPIVLCLWLAGQLAIVESSWGAETALSVIGIQIDGRAADTVSEVMIIAPGQDKAEKRELRKGAAIVRGTEIVVPPRTVLVLQSANGNQVRLQPGSRFRVNVVSVEGETYTLLLGQAFFKVSRALNFFNVNYQSFLAIVRGTEFDIAVEPEKEIRFQLAEGRLVVQREVKVKILEGDKVVQLRASETLAQGKKTQVAYRLGVVEYLKEFKTFKDAEEYFRRQLQEDEKSGEYERIQQGLNDLGFMLFTLGKRREAAAHFERALKGADERRDQDWELTLLNNLGAVYVPLGEYRKAIQCLEKALAIALKLYPDRVHEDIAAGYSNLGLPYLLLTEYRKAIGYFEKALTIELKLHPDGVHPGIADIYNNLGVVYAFLTEYRRAVGYFEKALTINLKLYPDGVRLTIADAYNNLGYAYYGLGEFQKAIGYYENSLAIKLKLLPDEVHPSVVQNYRNLSDAWREAGDAARSEKYAKKADEIEAKLKR